MEATASTDKKHTEELVYDMDSGEMVTKEEYNRRNKEREDMEGIDEGDEDDEEEDDNWGGEMRNN